MGDESVDVWSERRGIYSESEEYSNRYVALLPAPLVCQDCHDETDGVDDRIQPINAMY